MTAHHKYLYRVTGVFVGGTEVRHYQTAAAASHRASVWAHGDFGSRAERVTVERSLRVQWDSEPLYVLVQDAP